MKKKIILIILILLFFKKENNTIVISKSPSDRRFYKNIKSIIKKSKTSNYEQMFIN